MVAHSRGEAVAMRVSAAVDASHAWLVDGVAGSVTAARTTQQLAVTPASASDIQPSRAVRDDQPADRSIPFDILFILHILSETRPVGATRTGAPCRV
jgi:hypothetical protein